MTLKLLPDFEYPDFKTLIEQDLLRGNNTFTEFLNVFVVLANAVEEDGDGALSVEAGHFMAETYYVHNDGNGYAVYFDDIDLEVRIRELTDYTEGEICFGLSQSALFGTAEQVAELMNNVLDLMRDPETRVLDSESYEYYQSTKRAKN